MGSTKVKALVDTGAEMNIMPESLAIQLQLLSPVLQLPLRELSMNIMGIGGHSTPIVGPAEGINLSIDEEDEKSANFFIAQGKVYTVLPKQVRLELSKSCGEILSYELWDGERLCIPICLPKVPGWEMDPPRRIAERCLSIQMENYKSTSDSKWKTFDVNSEMADSNSGTADSDLGTADSDLGTADSNLGTAYSNSGTVDSNLGTVDTDSKTTDNNLRTTDNKLRTMDNNMMW
ncbi:hypothetical protein PSTG_06895 [Puccinia striiformis f. sp. tritici PST-78]|uniref:Peptidase A2 domain-containing protein n=1 Tax=Puccinia striiformis f. sp. tritici PST-78 TaxID=1165861 RepID=A0A0L0VLB0_9BASI|nr:hypothetical protein PSTG_06895 [Puccinia striiformis f. sp. tritici PST-78]